MEIVVTIMGAVLIVNTICLMWILLHLSPMFKLALRNQEDILDLLEILYKNKL
jgi:hypothetical protein